MNQADRFVNEQLCQVQQDPAGVQPPVYGWQRAPTMGEAWCNFWTRWTFSGRASIQEFYFMWVWLIAVYMVLWLFMIVSAFLALHFSLFFLWGFSIWLQSFRPFACAYAECMILAVLVGGSGLT